MIQPTLTQLHPNLGEDFMDTLDHIHGESCWLSRLGSTWMRRAFLAHIQKGCMPETGCTEPSMCQTPVPGKGQLYASWLGTCPSATLSCIRTSRPCQP